jgi:hypothetical protein
MEKKSNHSSSKMPPELHKHPAPSETPLILLFTAFLTSPEALNKLRSGIITMPFDFP